MKGGCIVNRLLANLRIRSKLWLGFGLLFLVLGVVAVNVLSTLNASRQATESIVSRIQPTLLNAEKLNAELEAAGKALGFYLLSHEESHRDSFLKELAQIRRLHEQLSAQPLLADEPELRAQVQALTPSLTRFMELGEGLLPLAGDNQANFPAFAYSSENINPLSQQMLQLLSQMVMAEEGEEPSDLRRELLLLIGDMRYAWVNVMSALRGYLAFRSPQTLDEIAMYREMLEGRLTRMRELVEEGDILTFEQEDALEQFQEAYAAFDEYLPQMVEIQSSERWRSDAWSIRSEMGPLMVELHKDMERLEDGLSELSADSAEAVLAEADNSIVVLGVMLLANLLIGVLAAWFLSRIIAGPIDEAAAAMREIAEGDGDLTARLTIRGRDEVGHLCEAFNDFVAQIQTIIGPVGASTDQLNNAAEHMSQVTADAQRGVQRQRQETAQVASAMEQMSASAGQVAANAEEAVAAARRADEEAVEGRRVVGHTVEVIESLAAEVERAASVIVRLEQDSEQIGGVLDVIRDITEQTNMLALNAAIEAARAGEAGRGFAVVADEVRSLASRTQQSTAEIQAMIEKLQGGAREAAAVMAEGREQAGLSVEEARRAGASLEAIAEAVSAITAMNAGIASAAEQQGQVALELNGSIEAISQVAEQTTVGTQQLGSASNQLISLSGELRGLVGRFKT